ncbi:MAG: hypothetical protein B0D96_04005 [Candidatus Sedimenticola endophacoides]|uniref:Uncharacterized protein n=1 Tax=Candidatus Sedimenticola endophacoides TaxID=2548426 RepID=A0A657PTD7_9GAMM|nr:MAG: hypothetical protein B0D94_09300 [Candidatus Sedimenticola endophacoides]OQX36503.1 MAG: hypothetical protein B0D96_04005 [Candidatus Sedimenticola endophacoides]OQX40937.1 MAG: hypothetical protein B0D89_05875 [Candidatus Sedimenticola endophacoides]OQX44012.1 MAG: hypothetical protein B0D86_06560 [Candidatus Sedimenticola endophacoides]OQX44509.1 MAG: hypothetical protein B0D85_06810 [Candidatus Sedimenticola endophacoides]
MENVPDHRDKSAIYKLEENTMINRSYVMRDQVRHVVQDIESCNITRLNRRSETQLHLIAVSVVTFVYILAAAVSG